jgi:hypothetical protein
MIHSESPVSPKRAATGVAPSFLSSLLLVVLAAGLAGCISNPASHESRSVRVCAAEGCVEARKHYSAEQMLHALDRLFRANDGAGMKFCSADPGTFVCKRDDVGYFVLGGLVLPGRGSSSSGKVSEVRIDAASRSLRYVMLMNLRFLGVPLLCAPHGAVLAVRSVDDIVITDNPYLCNWMAVGIMTASFSFVVESVDLDNGRLGGYWTHGVTGTGNGRGRGYAVIEFPHGMPQDENWLARK